jgi:PAS domain S-box-containing protein
MTWKPWLALPARWLAPLLLALLALVGTAVVYTWQVHEYREDVDLQERRRLLERMAVEQTRLEAQLGQGNHLQARRLVSSLGLYSGITHAWLADGEGRIQAALSRLQLGRSLAEILDGESAALRQAIQRAWGDRESATHIHVIPGEEAILGHVAIAPGYHLFLRVDLTQPLAARLYAGRWEIWREAGMTLLFAALLAVLLHLLWFRRTARLTAVAAALGAGRMEARAGLAGHDELAVIGAAIDRMAAQLQQRQAQLRQLASLIEHSPVVAIAWRNAPGWPVSFVSDNVAEWGYAPEELRSGRLKYADLIHPEDRPRIQAAVVEHLGHGPDHYTQEYRLRRSDGQWLWIEDRAWLSRAADGTVTAIEGVLLDVSERRRLREAERQSEERYRAVAEDTPLLICRFLPDCKIGYVNEAYCRYFGKTAEELIGTSFLFLIPEEDRAAVLATIASLTLESPTHAYEHQVIAPDGEFRWQRWIDRALFDAEGNLVAYQSVGEDITERQRLENEIRRANAELEERVRQRTVELAAANQELETFTYSVSHDLKAPLRGIDGYSQLLLADHGDRLDEEGRLFLNNVRQGVARMNQLIEDLLAYSRMERRGLRKVALELGQEVVKALSECKSDIEARQARVEVAVQGLTIHADPDGLALVLRNLIDNALKFARDRQPPLLRICGNPTDQSAILSIQDNGIGFDMRFHDRIFEIFQRLQRAEDYPGTGVGLAIVRKAAQRMGGRVWAESAPGQGATFYLELPR